jgi:hypothetical protein
MSTRIQHKRGTAAAWAVLNPVLALAEIGYERDTGQFKIGDGEMAWNDLPYSVPAVVDGGLLVADPEPAAVTLYFLDRSGDANEDWETLANWWLDDAHTEPATSLPTAANNVVLSSNVNESDGPITVANLTMEEGRFRVNITVTGMATFNGESQLGATLTGNATFNDDSQLNEGTVTGTATFNDDACNEDGTAGTFVPDPPPSC